MRTPNWIDRRFRFAAMRFNTLDAPEQESLDGIALVAQIESKIQAFNLSAKKDSERNEVGANGNQPSSTDPTAMVLGKKDVIELAVQTWRLSRRIDAVDAEKLPRERKALSDSLRRFQSILESLKVEAIDPVGQTYIEGWVEVEVVSWEPPDPETDVKTCRVKQTIAPIVRRNGDLLSRGQIVVTDPSN